jgi:hypothetical protein
VGTGWHFGGVTRPSERQPAMGQSQRTGAGGAEQPGGHSTVQKSPAPPQRQPHVLKPRGQRPHGPGPAQGGSPTAAGPAPRRRCRVTGPELLGGGCAPDPPPPRRRLPPWGQRPRFRGSQGTKAHPTEDAEMWDCPTVLLYRR